MSQPLSSTMPSQSPIIEEVRLSEEMLRRVAQDPHVIYYNESIAELDQIIATLPPIKIPIIRSKVEST